jgi:hypothetical protein
MNDRQQDVINLERLFRSRILENFHAPRGNTSAVVTVNEAIGKVRDDDGIIATHARRVRAQETAFLRTKAT